MCNYTVEIVYFLYFCWLFPPAAAVAVDKVVVVDGTEKIVRFQSLSRTARSLLPADSYHSRVVDCCCCYLDVDAFFHHQRH